MSDSSAMYSRQLPWVQTVEKDTAYRVCTCGKTTTAPACDGQSETCAPHEHRSGKKEQLFICGCNHSKNMPFCDGSHNKNDGKTAGQLMREFFRNPRGD